MARLGQRREDVGRDEAQAEKARRRKHQAERVGGHPLAMRQAHQRDRGHEEDGGELGVEAEPQRHAGGGPEAAAPRLVVVGERAQHEQDRGGGRDRRHDVVGQHRRPREVERVDEQEERGDRGPGAAVERGAQRVDEPGAEGRREREGQDEADLVQPEEAAGERGREPPREAVRLVVLEEGPPDQDGVHLVAEDEVVAEAEAAEPNEPQDEAQRHEGEHPEPFERSPRSAVGCDRCCPV